MLNETELQAIEERRDFAMKNGHGGSVGFILIERHLHALLSAVRELQRQNDELTDVIGQCRAAAGWGTPDDPMNVHGWSAMGDPKEVPGFIRDQFERLQRQVQERWIPIEKQHPEEEGRYFILYSHKGKASRPFIADLFFDGIGWQWSCLNAEDRVTHWMPIPEQTP